MNVRTQAAVLPAGRSLAMNILLTTGGTLLLALLAQVKLSLLPLTPVPFTGQVLAVMLLGGLLGPWLAPAAVLEYLLIGAVGAPVFTQLSGGIGVLTGFTGGYLVAFIPAAALYAVIYARFAERRYGLRMFGAVLAGAAATAVIYLGGWAWLTGALHFSAGRAYALGVAPFIPLDLGKAVLAASVVALWPRKLDA